MKKLIVLLAILPELILAQGVRFEKTLSWNKIREKAKREHKFIFVDCYASWCGPCKGMDRNTYPDAKVGEALSAHFISVKMQMDTARTDDEQTKFRYAEAHALDQQYHIRAYPSFLFFSPDGKLVHEGIGYQDPEQFIRLAERAMDPATQFFTLLDGFRAGKNPDSLYSAETIGLLSSLTESSTDPGFEIFSRHADAVDAAMHRKNFAQGVVDRVLIKEDIDSWPVQSKDNAEWEKIKISISKKYDAPTADRVVTKATIYSTYGKDWPAFTRAIVHYTDNFEDLDNPEVLDKNAKFILQYSKDKTELERALAWTKHTLSIEPDNVEYQKTRDAVQAKLNGLDAVNIPDADKRP